jgi:hypothetical protein
LFYYLRMSYALGKVLHPLQIGEELIADGIGALVKHWQASTTVIGKLCTGADRWQAALRQIQTQLTTPVNLPEILRSRTIL